MRAIDVMSSPVYVVAPTDNVAYARNLMLKHRVSRLLVMEGDELRGFLTKKDIAYRLRQTEKVNYANFLGNIQFFRYFSQIVIISYR